MTLAEVTAAEEVVETTKQLREQLREHKACWFKLRQDLEKTRLLVELSRKRERMKRELVRIFQLQTLYELNAFSGVFLQSLLDILVDYDRNGIFASAVDPVQVPSYYDVIKEPMNFSLMQERIHSMHYQCLDQFEVDMRLIISNCVKFNPRNTYFYKEALKMKEKVIHFVKLIKKLFDFNFF